MAAFSYFYFVSFVLLVVRILVCELWLFGLKSGLRTYSAGFTFPRRCSTVDFSMILSLIRIGFCASV